MRQMRNKVNITTGFTAALLIVIIFYTALPAGFTAAPEVTYGDLNGDGLVDVRDVVMAMQYVLKLRTLTDKQITAADVTGDGEINVKDVVRMMQYALGLIDNFRAEFKLGSEVLLEKERDLVRGKKVGLVTNQSGVNSKGESTIDILHEAEDIDLAALYGPEHGIDGLAGAGEYVESYLHAELGIPVYSLYGQTRMP
ncbi:MAG: exo-beta-N-acetylmuramidase NamZ domain-containing protein, partial [Bacillota bacterium]